MHAASDQTADVHCLELRTGDFVQFVPPNANAAALDFAKVSTPSLEFRMPQVVPCLRVSLRALPGVIRSGARVLLSSCVAQVYSDLDALQRDHRRWYIQVFRLGQELEENGTRKKRTHQRH